MSKDKQLWIRLDNAPFALVQEWANELNVTRTMLARWIIERALQETTVDDYRPQWKARDDLTKEEE